jgi:hypothetical protein
MLLQFLQKINKGLKEQPLTAWHPATPFLLNSPLESSNNYGANGFPVFFGHSSPSAIPNLCDAVEVFFAVTQHSDCRRFQSDEQNAGRRKESLFDHRMRRVTWIESSQHRRMGLFILKGLLFQRANGIALKRSTPRIALLLSLAMRSSCAAAQQFWSLFV